MTTLTEAVPGIPEVPAAMQRSPLFAGGNGIGIYAGLPDPITFDGLHKEAVELYPTGQSQQCEEDDHEDRRGGRPRRSLISSTAGPIQDAWYASEFLIRFIAAQLGVPVVPSGNRGSYSYYARSGDFLDLHRDIDTCDITVITCLHDNSAATDPGGALVLYPGRIGEPLSAIRAAPDPGAWPVKLQAGQTIVFPGGLIPHRVIPVAANQLRIISALCFRARF